MNFLSQSGHANGSQSRDILAAGSLAIGFGSSARAADVSLLLESVN